MSVPPRLFCILLTALGLALSGCESTDSIPHFVSDENLANTKEEALALAEGLPSAEEVAPGAKPAPATVAAREEPKKAYVEESTLRDSPAPKLAATPPSVESPFLGMIVLLNLQKGFVIVDFSKSRVPPMRSELGVYRSGIFVGSLRITPPSKPPLVSADILTGTLRRGDTVR